MISVYKAQEKKNPLLASAAISRQSLASSREGIWLANSSLLGIAENSTNLSPPLSFSKSALSESQPGLNSWKPKPAGPWNSCGHSSREPLTSLLLLTSPNFSSSPNFFSYLLFFLIWPLLYFYLTFSEGLLKSPQRVRTGFLSTQYSAKMLL